MSRRGVAAMVALVMLWLVLLVAPALVGPLHAQEAAGPANPAAAGQGAPAAAASADRAGAAPRVAERELVDFRNRLVLAFSFVFVLIIGYLVVSQRKNAALRDDIALLRDRLARLEQGSKGGS